MPALLPLVLAIIGLVFLLVDLAPGTPDLHRVGCLLCALALVMVLTPGLVK